MQVDMQARTITCLHCGTTFLLSEFLDKDDYGQIEKDKDIDLEKKVKFNEALKQGETYLFQAEYVKAEESFKLALSLDEKNFKPYLGIVRAKTKNLNFIPQNDDYKNYAKKALSLAGPDDYYLVKGDLDKLEILKQENAKIREQNRKSDEQRRVQEENRRIKANFFSKIAYLLTGLIACAVLVGIVVTMVIKNREKDSEKTTVEISTSQQFLEMLDSKNTLLDTTTIVLKCDIDFGGAEFAPIGKGESFKGTFRGNGYKLKNFSLKVESSYNRVGLFETLDGATISGIILENVTVKTGNLNGTQNNLVVGFIAGYAKDSSVSLCGVEDTCSVQVTNSGKTLLVGGLVGWAESSNLTANYSNAKITINESVNNKNNHYIGGVCGYSNDSKLTNCLFAGNIDVAIEGKTGANAYAGAIAGFSKFTTNKSSISNCAFAGSLKCISEKLNCKIAAVTNFDGEIDINRIYENIILISNFENKDGKIDETNLENYDTVEKYFTSCKSLEEFKQQADAEFGDSRWDKSGDIPKLKNKITETNVGDFLLS